MWSRGCYTWINRQSLVPRTHKIPAMAVFFCHVHPSQPHSNLPFWVFSSEDNNENQQSYQGISQCRTYQCFSASQTASLQHMACFQCQAHGWHLNSWRHETCPAKGPLGLFKRLKNSLKVSSSTTQMKELCTIIHESIIFKVLTMYLLLKVNFMFSPNQTQAVAIPFHTQPLLKLLTQCCLSVKLAPL